MAEPKVVVTQGGAFDHNVNAITPGERPNLYVVVMPAVARILVRVARTYLQSVLGLLGVGMVAPTLPVLSDVVLPSDAVELFAFALAGSLFPAVVSALQNILEILTKLDATNPELRG